MSRDLHKPACESSIPEGVKSVREDWTELRTLLLAPEHTQLDELRDRLDNHIVQPGDVSRVLPDAFAIRGEGDPQLATALTPYVENGFVTAVQKSPRTIVDAIAPIMGPAIRQAIARALQSMTQSFQHTLDESLSVRGLRWRLEAWRTGKPFAEVVLLHRLRYRVEQVFLIHRETGLLLHHVASDGAVVQDQHVVSGMLTAIQSYVQDSFGASPDQTLDQFQVGEWTVWIEQGSQAYVACVIRGAPPASLRENVHDALDHIHALHAKTLAGFVGDAGAFRVTQPQLERCLQAHYEPPVANPSLKFWILIGVLLLGAVWWGWTTYQTHSRWSNLLERLREEPGIVLTQARSMWGGYHIEGLRDLLAKDPRALVIEAGLDPSTVKERWSSYYAMDAPLVLARAHSMLRPPETVTFRIDGDTLIATGYASTDWAGETRRLAPLIPGISRYRDEGVVATSLPVLLDRVNRTVIRFGPGSSTVESSERPALNALSMTLRELDQAARQSGHRVRLEIHGSADETGPSALNLQLSHQRARAVFAILAEDRIGEAMTLHAGIGRADLPGSKRTGANQRVVTLRASLAAVSSGKETPQP